MPRLLPYALCTLFTALSCLSKAWGMSFFVLLLALDFYPLRRITPNPRSVVRPVAEKTSLILIGLATAYLAAQAQHGAFATKTLDQWSITDRLVQSAYGLWFYVQASIWPTGLSPLYQLPTHVDPLAPRFLAAYAFDIAALSLVIFSWKRLPAFVSAAAIYTLCLLPVLGLLQSGEQFVADRYSYIAAMPLAVLAAAGVLALWRRLRTANQTSAPRAPAAPPRARGAAALITAISAVAILTLASFTFAQTTVWRTTESLWRYAVTVMPTSEVLLRYADELQRQGRLPEAAEAAQAATHVDPADGRAWFTYANIMRDRGNLQQAEIGYLNAAKTLPQAYQAHQNLGLMYKKHGHVPEALAQFRLAVADVEKGGRRPLSGGPYMVLGITLQEQNDWPGAESAFRKALDFPDTRGAAAKELQAFRR